MNSSNLIIWKKTTVWVRDYGLYKMQMLNPWSQARALNLAKITTANRTEGAKEA
jgi:hypothetical protein